MVTTVVFILEMSLLMDYIAIKHKKFWPTPSAPIYDYIEV